MLNGSGNAIVLAPCSRAYDKFDITFGFPGRFLRMRSCKPDGNEQKRHTCPKHPLPHLPSWTDVFSFLQALCSDSGKTCHEAMTDRKQRRNRAR
jgi:hypothetical protein